MVPVVIEYEWELAIELYVVEETGPGDYNYDTMKGSPMLFHHVHSENIEISPDKRRAKRVRSFCKGICFSLRPVAINERVYVKLAEVSSSWSGVVRFGFTSWDPEKINAAELPRYACPDLTNKPGYWAKALSARYAEPGNVIFFYVMRGGEVMFGINGEEKGVFFSGVVTDTTLWALVDIYGNTTVMEFVEGHQINNLSVNSGPTSLPALHGHNSGHSGPASLPSHKFSQMSINHPSLNQTIPKTVSPYPSIQGQGQGSSPWLHMRDTATITYHNEPFAPMLFHRVTGKHVTLLGDRTIAMRQEAEYCNAYVFTHRALLCGEKLVIKVTAVDRMYTGGLAFGMTACDPAKVNPSDLPEDSDNLIDRPEYWVVFKNVCMSPEIGDELSFHLTEEGEVRYGKNGQFVKTLMHVDKTLPMWPFFDVYGDTQCIRLLGVTSPSLVQAVTPASPGGASRSQGPNLTVALPPPRTHNTSPKTVVNNSTPPRGSSSAAAQPAGGTPPPRPPPPRSSPSAIGRSSPTPPTLPPKHHRPVPQPPMDGATTGLPPSLPPPLIPTPGGVSTPHTQHHPHPQPHPHPQQQVPAVPPRRPSQASALSEDPDETNDNASNECSVCLEKDVDCVLYTCGHMCMCYECAMDVKGSHMLCPICRQQIKDVIKIYRS